MPPPACASTLTGGGTCGRAWSCGVAVRVVCGVGGWVGGWGFQVRTTDDALLNVKVMIFYEIVSVERMLDTTHDPIADFINGIACDLMNFGSKNT